MVHVTKTPGNITVTLGDTRYDCRDITMGPGNVCCVTECMLMCHVRSCHHGNTGLPMVIYTSMSNYLLWLHVDLR